MNLRIVVSSVALLHAACGLPGAPAGSSPSAGIAPAQTPPPEQNIARAIELAIPISEELKANGGVLSVLRLPNAGALVHEKIVVAPGTETLTLATTNEESLAVTDAVARSTTVAQPGCGTPLYSTGVVHRVPEDFATIQEGINAAAPGDTVLVGPGTWTEYLQMRPGVRLRGSGAGLTVLDGQGQPKNLVDLTASPGVVISGFTFRGVPRADIGCAQPDDPFACSGDWYAAAIYGDGHWLWYQDYVAQHPELQPVEPVETPTCTGAFAFIYNNVFEQNFIAVMPYFHTRLIVTNNIFRDNAVAFAANHLQDRGALLNNVFWNNGQVAVGIQAGYVDVINNIIGASATGYRQEYIQEGQLACNLFWQNVTSVEPDYPGAQPRITFGVDGNLETDPLFTDVANANFHLSSGSPGVDTGCTAASIADPDGSPVDIGAYGGPYGGW